ncbi:hypothetical protein IW261DRAFT_1573283 [Armillaria novae-zelandiae]|uniref:Uncharacterized protein n=1 Tax=Armillaria novae-zelandiae TaxID=153914 RepID=A0AA39U1R7_9AGAR|nr:hypothetical protein IW261DRAFT_1573283 [Armillaria novae-zelandiae]
MPHSPSIHRLSSSSSKEQQYLINAYKVEEERFINLLSGASLSFSVAVEAAHRGTAGPTSTPGRAALCDPSVEMMLESLHRENEQLRNSLVDTERDFIRVLRLNDIYREELIEHRMRLGVPVDNLVGLHTADLFSQPIYRQPSPSNSVLHIPTHRPSTQIPIGRPSSIRRGSQLSLLSSFTVDVDEQRWRASLSVNPTPTFATPSRGFTLILVPPPTPPTLLSPSSSLHP